VQRRGLRRDIELATEGPIATFLSRPENVFILALEGTEPLGLVVAYLLDRIDRDQQMGPPSGDVLDFNLDTLFFHVRITKRLSCKRPKQDFVSARG
jgi:hypothetical protein